MKTNKVRTKRFEKLNKSFKLKGATVIKDKTIYHTILIENNAAIDIISLDQPKITQIYCKKVTFMI